MSRVRQGRGDAFEGNGTGCLDENGVAGLDQLPRRFERFVGVARPRLETVAAGDLAHRDHLDLELGRQLCDLPVVPVGVLAELGHSAQYRDAAAAGAALCQVRSAASIEVGLAL